MSFFNSLYNSLFNIKWLRDQKNNTSWAWGYFFLLVFLISGLAIITLGYKVFQELPNVKQKIATELPEFQAVVKNGELQVIGPSQPFVKEYGSMVFVVDTVSTGTVDIKNFVKNEESAGVLITKNKIEIYNPENKSVQTVQPYENNFETNRSDIIKELNDFVSNKNVSIFLVLALIAVFIFLVISNLSSALLLSVIFYSITKRQKIDWKFKEIFGLSLFALTISMILDQFVPTPYDWFLILIPAGLVYVAIFRKDDKMQE